ncbi:hypothetical protein OHA09_34655 [Streptomyces longwoodensis]|uniref:hypothetical protein n=1 Tax=Streptomyces longwoodensis TaxID=68231 RepID=UPI002E824568|nr:hypothetical protein [Streptomyces longwoodensis]WTI49175.1 hypothetical protein OG547_33965 [Streptomyces longwoodensis]WUC61876.1 hypothetical protein OHA09_34655 [Streptomyces longwoodensis]
MSPLRRGYDVPNWTRPGARWVFWTGWAVLCANLVLLVWRVAEGHPGEAVYPAVMVVVFGCLLIANRANRRRRTERT